MAGAIRIGIGGWTFEPWRGVFYPKGLPHKRKLEFAARAMSSIEINGTYYSTFKPNSWRKWAEATPDGFVFSVKASRFCTNRKVLGLAGAAVDKFIAQGLTQLGAKLGPINWQFMATKKFDGADFEAFLRLLPKEKDGLMLRHALEVRHASFATAEFYEMAARYNMAIVHALDEDFPEIDQPTADFSYVRLMETHQKLKAGVNEAQLAALARLVRAKARRGDVFAYFISGAKMRNPAAAQALMRKLG